MPKCPNCGGPVTFLGDHLNGLRPEKDKPRWTCLKDTETYAWASYGEDTRPDLPKGMSYLI